MNNFLLKAGFAEGLIQTLVDEYEGSFAKDFPVVPFDGIADLLHTLRDHGCRMGIVTSNTAKNVRACLGPKLSALFEFILGIDNAEPSKKECIKTALQRLKPLPTASVVYIGDTLGDYNSAAANKLAFIGVGYGFEDLASRLPSEATAAIVVATVDKLRAALIPAQLTATLRVLINLRIQTAALTAQNACLRIELARR
jgi:phosphoglycolate phosphatase-like HAD superfamily hydrolase